MNASKQKKLTDLVFKNPQFTILKEKIYGIEALWISGTIFDWHFFRWEVRYLNSTFETRSRLRFPWPRVDLHTPKMLIIQFHTSSVWENAYHRDFIQLSVRMALYVKKFFIYENCMRRSFGQPVTFTLLLFDRGVCLPFNKGTELNLKRNQKSTTKSKFEP